MIQNREHYACATRYSLSADRLQVVVSCLHDTVARFRTGVNSSLRSCPLPINPLCLSREEGMIHFFDGSRVKMPHSGLFSDWIGNNANDLRRFDWPKCRHPLVVVN